MVSGGGGVLCSTMARALAECGASVAVADLKLAAAEDYLEYLGQDEQTRTIVAYMEGVKDGRRFFEVAREVGRRKPIILWKGGLSEHGARAAASHRMPRLCVFRCAMR